MADVTVSTRLVERFGTLVSIGEGAMGVVFEGYDAKRQCAVAIKMLKTTDAESVRRLQREAAVLSRVQHRNVCGIFELGQTEGKHWIAMPLISGLPLDQAWQGLSLGARIALLIDVCQGVEAAHAAGLIHRDLKPANILVERTASGVLTPVVMDFGIARNERDPAGSLTATGEVVGTPDSMSPEQVVGDRSRIDRRSDVWAIGCLLYRAICDHSPYTGNSAAEVMAQIVTQDAVSPRRYRRSAPSALARVCLQCLEREADRRYPDATAIREDLQRFLDGQPVRARDTGIGFAVRRSWRHNRAAWLIALALSGAIVLVLAGLLRARVEANHREQLAKELGAIQESVRSRMQIAYLSPLHDLRPERDALARLGDSAMLHQVGESAGLRTLARRSSGLSALALGNDEQVVQRMTPLVASGAADAVDRAALAAAHLHLYGSSAARFIDLPTAERDLALAAARSRHLEPARALLAAVGSVVGPEHVQLLLSDGRIDAAQRLLAKLPRQQSAEYSATLLAGELAMAEAADHASHGQRELAQASYRRALARFEQAAVTARSDPHVLDRVCDAAVAALRERISKAAPAPASPLALHPACFDAIVANPDDPISHETLAAAWEAIATNHDLRNERAAMDFALTAAIQHADLAVRRAPRLLGARLIGARARHQQAGRLADDLHAAQAHYDQAIAMLVPLTKEAPGFASAVLLLGQLQAERARQINNHSAGAAASYLPALKSLREARRLRPQDADTINALGLTLVFQFYVLRDDDLAAATAVMQEAIRLLDEVLARSPEDPDSLFGQGANLGDLWGAKANYASDNAAFVAAEPLLDQALDLLARLRRVAPGRADAYSQPIAQLATYAELARARGLPRDRYLAVAQQTAAAAQAAGVKLDHGLLAWWALETAISRAEQQDRAAAAAFRLADQYLRIAEADPDEFYSATRQRLEWVVANLDWRLRTDQAADAVIAQGTRVLKSLLEHPRGANEAIVHCNAGGFHWLLASHGIDSDGVTAVERLAQAEAAFGQCQKLSASYAKRWQAMAERVAAASGAERPPR
ncbi:MAG: hypothetical protein COS34_11135 [Lysobacterales bacterium CG02_land_8_20_14_3_00_62_12]|nr:MAG: hypothetical protein COS34_11135 [Xanthomonadales bacterium CG02_land_8_20_14_3_00_62_12]